MKTIINFDKRFRDLTLVSRPSKRIKSPYVSDAKSSNGQSYLVHTPCLGLGDQCFTNSKIYVTPSSNSAKTDYVIQAVEYKDNISANVIIGANPFTTELICKKLIANNIWNPFKDYKLVSKPKAVDYNGDIFLENNEQYIIVEVKSVVCATYNPKTDIHDLKIKYHDHKTPFVRAGVYPYGGLNQSFDGYRVVSERSVRQLDYMIKNRRAFKFAIIFIVNRNDCDVFKPFWKADYIYAKYLRSAQKLGIEIFAVRIAWTSEGCYFDGELKIDMREW